MSPLALTTPSRSDDLGAAALRGVAGERQGLQPVLLARSLEVRIEDVGAEQGVVVRTELQRAGQAQALLLVGQTAVTRKARREGAGRAGLGEGRGRAEAAHFRAVQPAARAMALLKQAALGIGHRDQGPQSCRRTRCWRPAPQSAGPRTWRGRCSLLGRDHERRPLVVERPAGLQVDRRAQRAFLGLGRGGLAHRDAVEELGGEDVEVERAVAVGAARAVGAAGRALAFDAVDADTRVNCGPRPRTVIWRPSPASRAIETPGTRWMDSARLASGKSAMSSALMTSTTPLERRLTFMALCPGWRGSPVTTTSSTSAAASSCGAATGAAASAAIIGTAAVDARWSDAVWPNTAVRPLLETTVRSPPRSRRAGPPHRIGAANRADALALDRALRRQDLQFGLLAELRNPCGGGLGGDVELAHSARAPRCDQ
jgi:hypothetical protein